jgi:drug/metabolite transporter (DMT)-like permease
MKPIIIAMLVVQAAILLVTIWTALFRRRAPKGQPSLWSGIAFAMVIIAGTSIKIAESHSGQPGTDILSLGAPLLLGMAIMAILIVLRQRRGLD